MASEMTLEEKKFAVEISIANVENQVLDHIDRDRYIFFIEFDLAKTDFGSLVENHIRKTFGKEYRIIRKTYTVPGRDELDSKGSIPKHPDEVFQNFLDRIPRPVPEREYTGLYFSRVPNFN